MYMKLINRAWQVGTIGIIALSILLFHNNNNPKIIISSLVKNGDIKQGDLIYKVNLFGVVPMANAILKSESIEEYSDQKVYHLSAVAQSLGIISKFFSGSAVIDSYVETQELNPALFKQTLIVRGKQDIKKEVFYDQKNNIMSIAGVKRQIFPNTQDPLSAIFNLRRIDFNTIKKFEMNINTNQKNYILEAKADLKDISVDKKTYKIVYLTGEIRRRDKNPYHKSNVKMVLLKKEEENTPILIKVFASGIFINAKLIDIK